MLNDKPVEKFDADELKLWEKDEAGAPFWSELSRMFQDRVSGIRAALHANEPHQAILLAGQLEAIEEIMQLPSVLIQQQAEDEQEAAEDKEQEKK